MLTVQVYNQKYSIKITHKYISIVDYFIFDLEKIKSDNLTVLKN